MQAIYFICRLCMLFHIFALAVNLNAIAGTRSDPLP